MAPQDLFVPLTSSVFGGLVVAIVNHIMTRRRERDRKLADIRIEHLIKCWKQIERAAFVGDDATVSERNKRYDELEDAIASIMLLGGKREVEAASHFAVALADSSNNSANGLLNSLRDSLRAELKLEPVASLSLFFRMRRDQK